MRRRLRLPKIRRPSILRERMLKSIRSTNMIIEADCGEELRDEEARGYG
jgi:hypothetical protein